MRHGLLLAVVLLSVSTVFAEKNPLQEGFSLIEKGDYQKAFTTFSSLKSKQSARIVGMGISKYMSGDYERAAQYLLYALKSKEEQKKWVTHYFTALALFEQKRYNEAIPHFQNVIKLKKSSEIYFKLGVSLKKTGDYSGALFAFKKALELEPKFLDAYLEISDIYLEKRDFEEGSRVINGALTIFPEEPKLMYQKAKLLFTQGQFKEAEEELTRAMKFYKDANMLGLYSSIEKKKKVSPANPFTVKTVRDEQGKSKAVLKNTRQIVYLFILSMTILVYFIYNSKAKKERNEKLLYVNELLKKGDIEGAKEIMSKITGKRGDEVFILYTQIHVLQGDYDAAITECKKIKNEADRRYLEGLIYLYFRKVEEFKKHLLILEAEDNKNLVSLLKSLSFEEEKKLISEILSMFRQEKKTISEPSSFI